jgi:hypothetical protein
VLPPAALAGRGKPVRRVVPAALTPAGEAVFHPCCRKIALVTPSCRAARFSSRILACPITPPPRPSRQHPALGHGLIGIIFWILNSEFDSIGRLRHSAGYTHEFREIGAPGQKEFSGTAGAAGSGKAFPFSRKWTPAPDPFAPDPTQASTRITRPPAPAVRQASRATGRPRSALLPVRGHPRMHPIRPGCGSGGGHQHRALVHPDRRDRQRSHTKPHTPTQPDSPISKLARNICTLTITH